MVLAHKVGKARPFALGAFLSACTVLVYAFYWNYKAHDELYKQFELAREGRDEGVTWYLLGFPFPFLRYVYYAYFLGNVRYLRTRLGFPKSPSTGGFLALVISAGVSLYLVCFIGLILIDNSLAEDAEGNVEVADGSLFAVGLSMLAGGFVAYAVLEMVAYAILQRAVNEVWAAYDARMNQLMRPAPAPWPAPPRAPAPA